MQAGKMAALGNLVAGVSHELNTPLGAIRANTDVTKRALEIVGARIADTIEADRKLGRSFETLRGICETNASAAARIDDILKALRNFARLDESKQKKVDLHEGIESTLTLLTHKLGDKITVERDFGELPRLFCNPDQINQLLMNLLNNAIEAIESSGRVTVRTEQVDSDVLVHIIDDGVGIAEEDLERVFDPGFTTKGVGVGTGLGLPICYRIAQQHGGRIDVRSEPGRGAHFTVRLPIREALQPPA
ncbi:MAG: GHKL domain-containing protein [Myxococcales bacterium]|nr:GHKL domain-containing protein [Myxococcales bacterium]